MQREKIVQIRKKGGLEGITVNKNGSKLSPKLFMQGTKDRNSDGTIDGDYKGKSILDTKHFLAPYWNDMKSQWAWGGTTEDLVRLIEKMKLRHPKNTPGEGTLIVAGKSPVDRLGNRHDDVFLHPELYGKYYMENGRASLALKDPKQEFLHLCYKGNDDVEDTSGDAPMSKYRKAGTRYQIVSPKQDRIKDKKSADKEVEAMVLLGAMNNDENRLRAVASIMQLPGYAPSTDLNGTFLVLMDLAVKNDKMAAKFRKSYRERFLELAKMTDEELNTCSQVIDAKSRGFIRKRGSEGYLFNGERLTGIQEEVDLIKHFTDPNNQEDYLKLLDLLENADIK